MQMVGGSMEAVGGMLVGVILILLGFMNMKGHINSIHRYHRHRVSEADRIPFGRLMGLGSIICGAGVILYGLADLLGGEGFLIAGTVVLIICLAVGIGMMFYAMIKYNKGIF